MEGQGDLARILRGLILEGDELEEIVIPEMAYRRVEELFSPSSVFGCDSPPSSAQTALHKVSMLVDNFTADFAPDENLKLHNFIAIAEALPAHARTVAELVAVLGFSGFRLSLGPDGGLELLIGVGLEGMGLRGAGVLDKGELDIVLPLPRKPPDPSIAVFILSFCWICSLGSEARSLVISINLCCHPMIFYPHEAHFQALRDLDFCPPTDGPVLDRSTVAFYAWGCLPFFGSGKNIEGWTGWIYYVDLGPRYSDMFPPLTV